jgi:hypothetical protein
MIKKESANQNNEGKGKEVRNLPLFDVKSYSPTTVEKTQQKQSESSTSLTKGRPFTIKIV